MQGMYKCIKVSEAIGKSGKARRACIDCRECIRVCLIMQVALTDPLDSIYGFHRIALPAHFWAVRSGYNCYSCGLKVGL